MKTAMEIIKEQYEKKYGSQEYKDSNLRHTSESIIIKAMIEYAIQAIEVQKQNCSDDFEKFALKEGFWFTEDILNPIKNASEPILL